MPSLPLSLPFPLGGTAAYQPPVLIDPVVGNIGLIGESVIMLHLEEVDGIYPSDATGNLADLAPDGATTTPSSTACWAGRGRRFAQAASTALVGVDNAGRDTLLVREVSVQAIIAPTLATAAGTQTLVQRGNHDGTAGEAIAYGVELEATGDQIEVRMFWEDGAGAIHVQGDASYTHPGDGEFVLLTVTRRWESTGSVVIRYYAADQLLGEVTSANGDIAGGTTGHTMIGGRLTGGAWTNFLNADLDELRVVDYEMSADEIRETWRRLFVHQPSGVAMFAGLSPPGARWYDNPGNNIGRMVKMVGQSIGLGIAKAEELRNTWLPDAAPLDIIARWERVCGLATRPRDSLDVRRARVIAYLSRIRGFSLPALQQAFAGVFAQAAADVQILEFTNRIDDPFTAALAPERWCIGPDGTWSSSGGTLQVTANAGDDLRWDLTRTECNIRTPISDAGRSVALFARGERFVTQAKLESFAGTVPFGVLVGLCIQDRVANNRLWFGIKNVGGVYKLGYQIALAGVMAAFVPVLDPAPAATYWLRLRPPTGIGFFAISTMEIGYSSTSATAGFVETAVNTGMKPQWAGLGAVADGLFPTNLQAHFNDFVLISYNGDRAFNWYAYRDPALPGTADMVGAELLALKMRPAHTYAGACTSKSVLCDDARDGLCDRGPLGAL